MIAPITFKTSDWLSLIARIAQGRFSASTGSQQRMATALAHALQGAIDPTDDLDTEQTVDISELSDEFGFDEWDVALTLTQAGAPHFDL